MACLMPAMHGGEGDGPSPGRSADRPQPTAAARWCWARCRGSKSATARAPRRWRARRAPRRSSSTACWRATAPRLGARRGPTAGPAFVNTVVHTRAARGSKPQRRVEPKHTCFVRVNGCETPGESVALVFPSAWLYAKRRLGSGWPKTSGSCAPWCASPDLFACGECGGGSAPVLALGTGVGVALRLCLWEQRQ